MVNPDGTDDKHGIRRTTMRLKDKIAVVTGAASGIGKAIAAAYVREGARVAIADLDLKGAQATARALDNSGARAIGVAMDVTQEDQVEAGMAAVIKTYGGIDILVSNAGIQIVDPLDQFEFAKWKKLLAIHLDGAFLTTRAALRQMYKQGRGGSIIYMGSVHSKEASVLKAPYVTAKHSLIGLAKVVAKEGAKHGVRANVIYPGFVRTPLVEKQIPEQAQELGITEEQVIKTVMLKDTVDGEFTTVDDVAAVAVFFAGFVSNALTGQSLVVSHGWFMQGDHGDIPTSPEPSLPGGAERGRVSHRRHPAPQRDRIGQHRDIERGEEPDRQIPEDDAVDPARDQRLTRGRGAGILLERRLPQGEETGAADERLQRHRRQQRQVQRPPPQDAHPSPAAPRAQRHDDEAAHVEGDDRDMHRQDRVRQGRVEARTHRRQLSPRLGGADARVAVADAAGAWAGHRRQGSNGSPRRHSPDSA